MRFHLRFMPLHQWFLGMLTQQLSALATQRNFPVLYCLTGLNEVAASVNSERDICAGVRAEVNSCAVLVLNSACLVVGGYNNKGVAFCHSKLGCYLIALSNPGELPSFPQPCCCGVLVDVSAFNHEEKLLSFLRRSIAASESVG